MDARREAQRISGIFASRATTQTRFLAATRRDGASWAHFCVTRPRHTPGMPSGSCLELRPTRRRRMRESKSDRLLGQQGRAVEVRSRLRPVAERTELPISVTAVRRNSAATLIGKGTPAAWLIATLVCLVFMASVVLDIELPGVYMDAV